MAAQRYVVLGLANVRSPWFKEVGRWATSASIPVDFIKCISTEEVRARLGAGRSFSALLLDSGVPGIDRDLIDAALEAGSAVFVVDDHRAGRDWQALGATSTLPADFDRQDLMDQLQRHGRALDHGERTLTTSQSPSTPASWSGRLVAVTGGSGAGTSTVAMGITQGLATDPRYGGLTLLADLDLHGDLAMLHHARDIVPGLQELVEAHRSGTPSLGEIRHMVFDVDDRGYHLLLGLRRHRDWAALRPRAFGASLESLRRSYRVVVADIDADFEGEDQVGSVDVEDRNMMSRSTARQADLVVAVGTPTIKGLHDILRVIADLVTFGIEPARILPVLNRASRSQRQRAQAAAAFAELAAPISPELPAPLQILERRRLDDVFRDNVALPDQLAQPLGEAISAVLDQAPATEPPVGQTEPVPIAVGSLGHFFEDDDADYPEAEAG